jgi:hypothetical protein
MSICQYGNMQNMDLPHFHVLNMLNNILNMQYDMFKNICRICKKICKPFSICRIATFAYSEYSAYMCIPTVMMLQVSNSTIQVKVYSLVYPTNAVGLGSALGCNAR